MDPKDYTGKEWDDLLRQMNGRQIRNSMRRALRAEARNALRIAQSHLAGSGLQVRGSSADWKKGVRSFVYRQGTGFMITVKARSASRKTGKGEKSMHENRRGLRKPVLMWAEEGTKARRTKTRTKSFARQRKGHSTGRMRAYGFLEKAAPEMYRTVGENLTPEVGAAVGKVAGKCGFA